MAENNPSKCGQALWTGELAAALLIHLLISMLVASILLVITVYSQHEPQGQLQGTFGPTRGQEYARQDHPHDCQAEEKPEPSESARDER